MTLNSRDMAMRGRVGGFVKASRYPPAQLTEAARDGFLKRFLPEDTSLSPQERERRAKCSLRAYMAALSRRSVLARRGKNA